MTSNIILLAALDAGAISGIAIATFVVGAVIGLFGYRLYSQNKIGVAKREAARIIEEANLEAKDIRKDKACIRHNNICYWEDAQERENKLKSEAGDILWQLSGVCSVLGWSLDDIAKRNLDKLAARKEAGTIDGNGDGIIRDK